jgi:hypothetical protein
MGFRIIMPGDVRRRSNAAVPIAPIKTGNWYDIVSQWPVPASAPLVFRFLERFQLSHRGAYLLALLALHGWHLRHGFRHQNRVGNPILLQQEIHIPDRCLG